MEGFSSHGQGHAASEPAAQECSRHWLQSSASRGRTSATAVMAYRLIHELRGQRYRQKLRRRNTACTTSAAATITASTTAVRAGRVTRMVEKVHSARNSTFWGHRLASACGHLRLRLPVASDREPSASDRTPTRRRRANHSPSAGTGQTMHHALPPRGTRRTMSRNHHRIHTMVTMMLRLPMGDPSRPARMKKNSTTRLGTITANWNHLLRRIRSSQPKARNRSMRRAGGPGRLPRLKAEPRTKAAPRKRNAMPPAARADRWNGRLGRTTSSPSMKGWSVPQVTEQR